MIYLKLPMEAVECSPNIAILYLKSQRLT